MQSMFKAWKMAREAWALQSSPCGHGRALSTGHRITLGLEFHPGLPIPARADSSQALYVGGGTKQISATTHQIYGQVFVRKL